MPWEYLIISSKSVVLNDAASKHRILNNYGKNDWENYYIENLNTHTEFWFKRFVKAPTKPRKKKDPVKKE